MPRASLDKKPHEVAAMFDHVAERYDRTNDVLSLGQDRRWRQAVTQALDLRPGERVLDLAAGTGTSSEPLADAGALTVACDFSLGMLRVGHTRRRDPGFVDPGLVDPGLVDPGFVDPGFVDPGFVDPGFVDPGFVDPGLADPGLADLGFVAGDATRLPFADGSFDAVTISFGLRNVVDVRAALAEMLRVARRGGRLVICEFSHPTWTPLRVIYTRYLMRALPVVARRLSSDPQAYLYLAESIRAWPDQKGLGQQLRAAGWGEVAFRNLSGGIVALHRATRP